MVKPQAPPPLPTPASEAKKRAREPAVADLGQQIGAGLRALFDGVVQEPVPEKFRRLLDELERKSSKDDGSAPRDAGTPGVSS
jgi:hypothetical protein